MPPSLFSSTSAVTASICRMTRWLVSSRLTAIARRSRSRATWIPRSRPCFGRPPPRLRRNASCPSRFRGYSAPELSRARGEEGQEFLRVGGHPLSEASDHFAVGIEDRVIGNGDGGEFFVLQFLVLFRLFIRAVGVEFHQHQFAGGVGDLGARKHIGLHPMAISAGVAGEGYQHQFVFGARLIERLLVLILHPDLLRGGAVVEDAAGGRRNVRVEFTERRAEHTREQAEREDQ